MKEEKDQKVVQQKEDYPYHFWSPFRMVWTYMAKLLKVELKLGQNQENKNKEVELVQKGQVSLVEDNVKSQDHLETNKTVQQESVSQSQDCLLKSKEDFDQLLLSIQTLKQTKKEEKEENKTEILQKQIQILNEIDKKQVKVEQNGVKKIKFGSLNNQIIQSIFQESKETFNKLDEIESKDMSMANKIFTTVLQTPPKQEEVALNKATEQEIEKGVKSSKPESILMSCLKQRIESNKQNKVVFSKQSSIKSQVSMKLICCKQTFKTPSHYSQKFEDSPSCSFDDLFSNDEKLASFKENYIQNFSEKYKIPKSAVRITQIVKGSIAVHTEVDSDFADTVDQTNSQTNELTLHPYFQYFCLALEDFSPGHNFNFPKQPNGEVQTRGGWPYFQPVNCTRYALNVSKKYDNGKDDWLMMDGNKEEWAVAFHGVSAPDNPCTNASGARTKVTNSIMDGRERGEMLRAGGAQAYANSVSCNQPSQTVDPGIYCSPMIQIPIFEYTGSGVNVNGQTYFLVLQCRVNPKKIKVCSHNPYWVINDSKDIRPYGIILLDDAAKRAYPSSRVSYGDKEFSWAKYKDKIKVL